MSSVAACFEARKDRGGVKTESKSDCRMAGLARLSSSWRRAYARPLRVHIKSMSGGEVASVEASSGWQLRDLLEKVPAQPGESPFTRRSLLLGGQELRGLANLGAAAEVEVTLLLSRRLCVVTAASTGEVKVWCAETGACLKTLRLGVEILALSPDGGQVLSMASGDAVKLWSLASGQCMQVFGSHEDYVVKAVMSKDGEEVLTASCDGTCKLWSAATGECLRTLGRKGHACLSLAWSRDGLQIANGPGMGATIWNAASGEAIRTIHHVQGGWTCSADWAPGAQELLTTGAQELLTTGPTDIAKLWDVSTGACLQTFTHKAMVASATFSADGREVLTASYDGTAKLWSASTGECLQTIRHRAREVQSATLSADGLQVLTASWDGTARLWSVATGRCLQSFALGSDVLQFAVFSH